MRSLLPAGPELDDEAVSALYVVPPGHRHVRCNFAASLDGAIEMAGVSKPLSSPGDRRLFHIQRALADVVLVGQATAVAEGYKPAKGDPPPAIALIARTMQLPADAPFFTDAVNKPFLLVGDETDVTDYVDVARILRCGPTVDLGTGLEGLAENGLTRVLCEGGPRILGELVLGGLLDELCLTIAPMLAGPGNKPLVGGDQWPDPPARFTLSRLLEEDGVLFTSYTKA